MMETPQILPTTWNTLAYPSKRNYTPQEKEQLLRNFDIEGEYTPSRFNSVEQRPLPVEQRTRQFEQSLLNILETFRVHHEEQVLRVPRLVRKVTMAEFGDKYNGNIADCLRGLQAEKQGGKPATIDAMTKKRKWLENQEPVIDENIPSRTSKNGLHVTLLHSSYENLAFISARFHSPLKSTPSPSRPIQIPSVQQSPGIVSRHISSATAGCSLPHSRRRRVVYP